MNGLKLLKVIINMFNKGGSGDKSLQSEVD
jgi:hypothetical protein